MTDQSFDHERLDVTRMAMKFNGVAESCTAYNADIDYDYEHRFAEQEHDIQEAPEPWEMERRWPDFS